jgi:hypothetical protein
MIRYPFTFRSFAALLLFALVPVPGEATSFQPIAVTVHELDGIDRQDWPLTFSVPFPPATLREDDSIRVIDENGAGLPTQTRALRKWRDGSVRWMLVDTRVSVKARDRRQLRVAPGKSAPPGIALKLEDGAEAIHVDSGAMRFDVAKRRAGVLEKLQTKSGTIVSTQGLTSLLVGDGKSGSASAPSRVNVLESGPLRARFGLEGNYGNGFDYLIRLEAYAGQPFVRIWHTFTNVNGGRYRDLSQSRSLRRAQPGTPSVSQVEKSSTAPPAPLACTSTRRTT